MAVPRPTETDVATKNPKSSGKLPPAAALEASSDLLEQIRVIAYQMYEARGRADGHDLEDWLEAETQIRGAGQKLAA